jgi:hypothetical protein
MTDTISRIMKIRDGMTPDPLARAIVEREIAALQRHSSPDSTRAALELAIQRALMDDDSYGVGCDDQDDLEAAASFSATFIANAIASLPDAAATPLDRDKIWHVIAKQIACEKDCQEWPNGCGCAQQAANNVVAMLGVAQPSPDVEDVADIIRDKVYADENDKVGGVYDAAQKVVEYVTALAITSTEGK